MHRNSRIERVLLTLLCVVNLVLPNAAWAAGRQTTSRTLNARAKTLAATDAASSKIVFTRDSDVYIMNGDGSGVTRLTDDPAFDDEPTLSPDGARVAFTSTRAGNRQVFVMNADGSNLKQITTGDANNSEPAWSPEGSRVAFTSRAASARARIAVINDDGAGLKYLTDGSSDAASPAFAPDGSGVAFNASVGGNTDIYVVRADGSALRRLTTASSVDAHPAWSPDGRIAFDSDSNGDTQIYLMDSDGGNVNIVTAGEDSNADPTWSPDGKLVAFTSSRGGGTICSVAVEGGEEVTSLTQTSGDSQPAWQLATTPGRIVFTSKVEGQKEIFALDPAGGEPVRLTLDSDDDSDPALSPDGNSIAFVSTRDGGRRLFVMDAFGGNVRKLTDMGQESEPVWSPDGKRIAFTSRSVNDMEQIYIVNAEGTDLQLVSDGKAHESSPTWSPDGKKLAFQSSRDADYEIYIEDLSTGALMNLTDDDVDDYTPAWSPDGKRIAFVRSCCSSAEVYVIKTDGTGVRRVTNNVNNDAFPTWSHDGLRLAVADTSELAGTTSTNIYTFNADGTQFQNVTFSRFNTEPFWGIAPALVRASEGVAINGRITDGNAAGVAGVSVTLSGSKDATVVTDSNGRFTFTDVPEGGSYTVTPSKEGFTFDPPALTFTELQRDVEANFNAAAVVKLATVAFAQPSMSVDEGARFFNVVVRRAGDASNAVTVDYATQDGTANERGDYTTAVGTLRFNAGETEKSFVVLLTDDGYVEGNETFNVTLSNPTGGLSLGETQTLTVNINDNDAAPASVNPSSDTEFFVRQHYHDFLDREPDAAGLQFWANQIEECGTDRQCRDAKRVNVSAAFFLSIEFQNTGYLVHRLRRISLGDLPRYRDLVRDAQEIGRGVMVGEPGWEQKLEENKRAFVAAWAERPEFVARYAALSNAQFVSALWSNVGVVPTASGGGLVAGLDNGSLTRADVLRRVAESDEVNSREMNSAFVLMEYFGYLRRNPDDAPDANMDGYEFWLSKLNRFDGDFHKAEMVRAFIVSDEYQQRFSK